MRWRLYIGVAIVAGGSIAAVIIAIGSVTGADDVQRVRSALRLQTNCQTITIRRPSRAVIERRWASLAVQSADVDCVPRGPLVTYTRFIDSARRDSAVAASLASGGYCRLGDDAVILARFVGAASTVLSDMCQSLGGTLVLGSGEVTGNA